MKYTGTFKTHNQDTILVNIITDNNTDSSTEIFFSDEEPIIISQTSEDGIFSPIKSRSCTINIVTYDTYFDMYSSCSQGTQVYVYNITQGICLFYGYLTPCEYNQPYTYLDSIELEAVDGLSTLKDYEYNYVEDSSHIKNIRSIVLEALTEKLEYENVYITSHGDKISSSSSAPFLDEYISDNLFKEDKENMTWYDILYEICLFYKCSMIPYQKDVYIVDYNVLNQEADQGVYFYNLVEANQQQLDSSCTITMDDYIGEEQNIELDQVYNKITLKADITEVDDDEIIQPISDCLSDASIAIMSVQNNYQGKTYYNRLFEFNQNTPWKTYINYNCDGSVNQGSMIKGENLTENFDNIQRSISTAYIHPYYPYGSQYSGFLNSLPGQCALPAQIFSYDENNIPSKVDWTDRVLFFPQAQWYTMYLSPARSDYASKKSQRTGDSDLWYNDIYFNHLGGSHPVLEYTSQQSIQYSPLEQDYKNWLCITGDLSWQKGTSWTNNDPSNYVFGTVLYSLNDIGQQESNIYSRSSNDSSYNQGWPMLKMKINIGNKYWDGSQWTTQDSSFFVPYHKDNVGTDDEHLVWIGKNKPVCNITFADKVGKDCFAIPMTTTDNLYGQLHIQIYIPRMPYNVGTTSYNISEEENWWDIEAGEFTYHPLIVRDGSVDGTLGYTINYNLTSPVIFMDNFNIEFISVDTTPDYFHEEVEDEDEDDDDITYTNTLDTDNKLEYDDLELKINTYRSEKFKAKSFILKKDNNQYVAAIDFNTLQQNGTRTDNRQEMNIVNQYVQHYSSPKKIYNCVVYDYYSPYSTVTVNTLTTDNSMMVDEQQYNVKTNVNNLKLIEY